MKRMLFCIGVALFAAALKPPAAQAAAEFCPAIATGLPSHVSAASYRVRLGAASGRTVSGSLKIQTDAGWFLAPFFNVALRPQVKSYNDQGLSFSQHDFVSGDIVVTLPAAVQSIQYAYVSQAKSSGDTVMGWDARGSVSCLPTPMPAKPRAASTAPALPALSSSAVQLRGIPIDPPYEAKCTDPSEDIRVVKLGEWHVPSMLAHDNFTAHPEGVAEAVIAVDRDGSVLDSWLLETSGTPMLDQSVLDEAKTTTFLPGRAFCENVPGFYLLRVEFKQ